MSDNLKLFVLGKPRILLGGQPLTGLVSVKAQALLFYLVVTGKTFSRSALAGLFWGNLPEDSARANLRLTLSKLRKSMPDCLLVSWQSVAYNSRQSYRLDLNDFLASTARPEQADPAQLRIAMDLYRGDFLEDFIVQDSPEFETWVLTERERLRQVALKAGWQLILNAHERGAYAEGIEAAWKVLGIQPWHEEAHQQLMQLLARSGQRSAALAQYDVCRHVLEEELGVEPSPLTNDLYKQIKTSAVLSSAPEVSSVRPGEMPASEPRPHGNLPLPLTPLVGRDLECSQVVQQLRDPECRLLTILGPGGIGKTRLALAAAESLTASFRDGVIFVSLEEVRAAEQGESADTLIAAAANALGLTFPASSSPRELLLNHLADKAMLLVMDNMEKLREDDRLFIDILQRAPGVKILAASRQRLGVVGEWLFMLKGLSCAADLTGYAAAIFPAGQLFVQCARRLRPEFDPAAEAVSINRLCQLVDGFPLGIELAAQWVTVLSCAEIAERLERGMDMLTADPKEMPGRHHSLRVVMDDSWSALTDAQRSLFRRLSVFRGGFTLSAAEQVTGAALTQLAGLVNKSWLHCDSSSRYQVHALLRQYGSEQLALQPDEELAARNSHAHHYAEYLLSRLESLAGIDLEIYNLRVAWEWWLASQRIEFIPDYVQGLWKYYSHKGWFQEAASMLEQASGLEGVSAMLSGRWQLWLAEAYYQTGRIAECEEQLTQGLALMGENTPVSVNGWGRTLFQQVFRQALHRLWPSRFLGRERHDRERLLDAASALNRMGPIAYQSGDGLRTLTAAFWTLNLAELAGSLPDLARGYAGCCITVGSMPIHPIAEHYARLAIATAQSVPDLTSRAYALEIVALYRIGLGQWADAKTMLEDSAAAYDLLALPRGQIESRSLLANVHFHQGEFIRARGLYEAALAISQQQGDLIGMHWSLMGVVECTLRLGRVHDDTIMQQLEQVRILQGKAAISRADVIRYFGVLAQVHLRRGEFDQALEAARNGLRLIRQKPFAGPWTMEGYAGVAETFLSSVAMDTVKKAWRPMHEFARVFPIARPRALLHQGLYECKAGKLSQAHRTWQKGLTLAEQGSMPYEQALAHDEIGRHLDDPVLCRAHLQKAKDIYAGLGMPVEALM